MLEISNQWLFFVLDVSVKSLILMFLAWASLKVFRVHDPNLRHRIWSGVLLGMLTLPLLSYSLPTIPVSLSPRVRSALPGRPSVVTEPEQSRSLVRNRYVKDELASESPELPATDLAKTDGRALAQTSLIQENVTTNSHSEATAVPAASFWAQPGWSEWLRIGSAPFFVLWILITAYFGVRLIMGMWLASRISRRSKNITDKIVELTSLSNSKVARVMESGETCVPVTVGWFRPTILLPTDWLTWRTEKLKAIIAHEFTHVARRDFMVTIAAEINRTVYWFHPVSWWLRSQLSNLAEQACDDAAIGQTGDRTGYARHLLEVAGQVRKSSGRLIQPGLAMARESNVESRIETILDFKRPLSTRLTWKSSIVIALIMIPVVGATAAVRAVEPVQNNPIQSKSNESANLAFEENNSEESIRVHGQVIDPDGNPVKNAEIRLYSTHSPELYAATPRVELIHTLSVDSEGRFDKSFPREELVSTTAQLIF